MAFIFGPAVRVKGFSSSILVFTIAFKYSVAAILNSFVLLLIVTFRIRTLDSFL